MYLHVKFHDNDFNGALCITLRYIWRLVKENSYCQYEGDTPTMADLFKKLDEASVLKSMIHKVWVFNSFDSDLGYITCGLHEKGNTIRIPKWVESTKELQLRIDHYSKYLENFEISFEKTCDQTWNNGEDGWINLHTGKVFTL